jgi:hypothetical protein
LGSRPRRIVDRLLAIAFRVTQSYPDQAAASMFLSEGYIQRAKMAYRTVGEPPIGWEQKALDAAIHASELEPENEQARQLVKDRQTRLSQLASKRSVGRHGQAWLYRRPGVEVYAEQW